MCALLLCVAELATLDTPLFLLCSALLALQLVAGAASFGLRPRLAARVVAPRTTTCGEPFELSVHANNLASLPAFDLSLQLIDEPKRWEVLSPPRSVAELASHETIQLEMTARPLQRGVLKLPDVRTTSTFPLNLLRVGRTSEVSAQLIVLPSYRPLAKLDLSRLAFKDVGEQLQHVALAGQGGDYFGSREYVPGIPVRRWDYSSWARLGQPVLREFAEPQQPTVAIAVDNCYPVAAWSAEPIPELEAAISLAAAISEALTVQNFRIALLVWGDQVQDLSSVGFSNQHRIVCESLAAVAPAEQSAIHRLRPKLRDLRLLPRAVILLLNDWNADRAGLCDDLRERGCEVVRIFLRHETANEAGRLPHDFVVSVAEIAAGAVEIG